MNNKYILEAVLGGIATCTLCAVAVVLFQSPNNVGNNVQDAGAYEFYDEAYYDDSEYYGNEYYDEVYDNVDEYYYDANYDNGYLEEYYEVPTENDYVEDNYSEIVEE